MKFSKLSQLFLVSAIGLLVAAFFSACALVTIDYVFVACSAGSGTSSAGQIQTFAVDSQSGALRTAAPTVASGGVNPVSMVVTPGYANLYVAHQGTPPSGGSIVHFAIATNGTLTAKDTLTLTTTPIAMAVNSAGTYLYVVSCTAAANTAYPTLSCTGGATLAEYSLSSGTIGSAVSTKALSLYGTYASYSSDVLVPTGITVLANNSVVSGNGVYITAYDKSAYNPGCIPTPPATTCITSTANPGWVFGFTVGSGGVLTALANPYEAGIKPTAIAATPVDAYLYVTDYASNQLIGYAILGGGSSLSFLPNGPFRTGDEPTAITIDPRGQFIYITNSLDSTVSPYEIDLATGAPTTTVSATAGGGSNATDTQPLAVMVDPALGRFVYTANYLGNSVSGFKLDPTSGALNQTEATPYPTGAKPTAVIGVPHGNYSTQSVTP
ncbi:MAG: beta-propeller fold lactonase family protein [Terracidiphilus sp.]|jgi:6-phosphogluconolactonase (cycloisomerase 2 family)